jgi:STE24 endopeptidase
MPLTMPLFTWIFLTALAVSTLVHLWLAGRQLRHVAAHRDRVPDAFADRIPLDAHRKAADYTMAKTRLGRVDLIYSSLLLLGWTLGGGLQWLYRFWEPFGLAPLATGVVFLVSVFLVMALLELPFSLYQTFVIEERFGFNRTSAATFVGDLAKQALLTLMLGAPLGWAALWLMQAAGSFWWLYLWALWVGFSLVMLWAYPAVIAPLFNRFTPLDDQALKQRIETLLRKCGFSSRGIFVMDGSRRSGHGNAYFTGLGNNKRIVFFDTLLKSLDTDEIEAVLAHELGHFKRRHVQKRIGAMMLMSLAGLALLGWVIDQPWFFASLGVETGNNAIALILFMLVIPVFTFFLQPVIALLSRKHEFEADDYASHQANAGDLVQALVKLYKENASTLTPDPLYSAYYDSHPPAPVRVAHLLRRS